MSAATNSLSKTLAERGARYGLFINHATWTMKLKNIFRQSANWEKMAQDQQECLDMTAHKIGRILNGDPHYFDSWKDIAGYNKLVSDRLENIDEQLTVSAAQIESTQANEPSCESIRDELVHAMIDIETLGTKTDSYIRDISIVLFSLDTQKGKIFEYSVNVPSFIEQSSSGRFTQTDATVAWWRGRTRSLDITEEERNYAKQVIHPIEYPNIRDRNCVERTAIEISEAFTSILNKVTGEIWCRGPAFDIAILNHYFDTLCCANPLDGYYRKFRDTRTFMDIPKILGIKDTTPAPIISHQAFDDCIAQIKELQRAYSLIADA